MALRTYLLALSAMVALASAVACSTPVDAPPDPAPTNNDTDGAGGTTMRVYTVTEALALDLDAAVHVAGFLIDEGDGWQLCEAALESYPPQCGGDALIVEGLDTEGLPLEREGTVRWQDGVTVVGTIEGGVLTVTAPTAAS